MFIKQLLHNRSSFWFKWRLLQVKRQVAPSSRFVSPNWSTAHAIMSPTRDGKGTTRGVVFSELHKEGGRRRGELLFANWTTGGSSRCVREAGEREREREKGRCENKERLLSGKAVQAQQAEFCYTHWHTNTQACTNTHGWDEAQTDWVS